MQMTRVMATSL